MLRWMPWVATEERLRVHEGDPPAEAQRRRVLDHNSASPRLRARFPSKLIPTAADAMGGSRGASPGA